IIENISVPLEVEAMLDKRTSMGIAGNLEQDTKFQTANAIQDAANNPGGGASEGIGLGVGLAVGQQIAASLGGAGQAPAPAATPAGPPPLPPQEQWYVGVGGQQLTEHRYDELATLPRKPVATLGKYVYGCQKCGAKTESDAIADVCQFCGAALVADVSGGEMVVPEAVLPFVVDRSGVREHLRKWVRSRWFAPS